MGPCADSTRLRGAVAADLLLTACEQLEVEPQRAVLVGDSPWDVAAARAGMLMISVHTG
jgi:beta-phosphoglucomutase-like phosphatase (HAD superfamily)